MKANDSNSLFGPEDVISVYDDTEAVDDGTLVAINGRDRVTRTVWEWLVEKQPKDSRPPSCWPVAMMGWFTAAKISWEDAAKMIAKHGAQEGQRLYARQVADKKAAALSIGIIDQNRTQAIRTYEENTEGGIFKLFADEKNGVIFELRDNKAHSGLVTLWFVPNECGGITLMFPEDY